MHCASLEGVDFFRVAAGEEDEHILGVGCLIYIVYANLRCPFPKIRNVDMTAHLLVGVTLYQMPSPGPTQDPRKLSEPEFLPFYLSLELGICPKNFLNSTHI